MILDKWVTHCSQNPVEPPNVDLKSGHLVQFKTFWYLLHFQPLKSGIPGHFFWSQKWGVPLLPCQRIPEVSRFLSLSNPIPPDPVTRSIATVNNIHSMKMKAMCGDIPCMGPTEDVWQYPMYGTHSLSMRIKATRGDIPCMGPTASESHHVGISRVWDPQCAKITENTTDPSTCMEYPT